jgi:hypothetical protein
MLFSSKIFLWSVIFSFCMQLYSTDEEVPASPPPTAHLSAVPTPGEMVSRMQAEVLRKDRFISILGPEIVEPWGFNWDVLEDSTVPFGDSRRISAMSQVYEKLRKIARKRYDEEFTSLYTSFLTLRDRIFIVHEVRLETIAEQYFGLCFPGSSVECDAKAGGVQLGIQAKISLVTGEKRKYHVKTHSEGRLADKSSAAKRVNPQELLVYKILEHLGFGCETHFLQRSVEDVYIATLDAGHSGSFSVFEKATGSLDCGGDEEYGQSLWGSLQTINQNPTLNDWRAVETTVQGDEISKNFLLQVSALDMLSRILRLHDLLNNPDNFGFLKKEGDLPFLKVIDFRITDDKIFHVGADHFGGFLVGNGLYNYVASHRTTRYGLHDRPVEERVKTALHVLTEGSLSRSHECLEAAYKDVCEYITSTDVFAEHVSGMMEQLSTFRDTLHHNITFFTDKLQSWKPGEVTA